MAQSALAAYRVEAYNTAKESENKIHDDSVARRFGFSGGLVPGVDVYAYMTHLPVARWGREWLQRGTAACRFLDPVYDGETATIAATETTAGLDLTVTSRLKTCATGHASITADLLPARDLASLVRAEPPASRPPADEQSLKAGTWLGIRPLVVTPDFAAQYLRDARESAALYLAEGLVHPGTILRTCNWALTHNVVLGPWIHVGSRVHNLSVARVGETLTVAARVSRNYEHKGHRFVELDATVLAGGNRAVARVEHTAIYRPRQVAG